MAINCVRADSMPMRAGLIEERVVIFLGLQLD
jgi:hypothetical protein